MTGAFLAAVTYVLLTTYWSTGIGMVAGAGIILIGRAASGVLGIEPLQRLVPLPWVKRPGSGQGEAAVPDLGPTTLEGGARVAG